MTTTAGSTSTCVTGRYRADVNDNTGRRLRGKLSNKLYHNNHDGTFTDVTTKAGRGRRRGLRRGLLGGRLRRRRLRRPLRAQLRANVLYHNNGDGTFTDVSKKSGLADRGWSVSGVWFDYDGDGKLDVFVANYLEYDARQVPQLLRRGRLPRTRSAIPASPTRSTATTATAPSRDVTKEAGVFNKEGRAMSATVADFRNTGQLDIFVANDAMESDFFRASARASSPATALDLRRWRSARAGRASRRWGRSSATSTATAGLTSTSPTWVTAACT